MRSCSVSRSPCLGPPGTRRHPHAYVFTPAFQSGQEYVLTYLRLDLLAPGDLAGRLQPRRPGRLARIGPTGWGKRGCVYCGKAPRGGRAREPWRVRNQVFPASWPPRRAAAGTIAAFVTPAAFVPDPNDVDVASTSLERHGCGIHALRLGSEYVSRATAVRRERRNTRSQAAHDADRP